jgi:hypothetical protein
MMPAAAIPQRLRPAWFAGSRSCAAAFTLLWNVPVRSIDRPQEAHSLLVTDTHNPHETPDKLPE